MDLDAGPHRDRRDHRKSRSGFREQRRRYRGAMVQDDTERRLRQRHEAKLLGRPRQPQALFRLALSGWSLIQV